MPPLRLAGLTAITMIAFAGNSLLCRLALKQTSIDAASFTSLRIFAGAVVLWILTCLRKSAQPGRGNWPSALALFVYAAGFSFAYLSLPTGTGALVLFGAVQSTMIGYGLVKGERLLGWQFAGLGLALVGLVVLFLPGLSAPPLGSSLLMLGAGVAWGVYSLRGRGQGDPTGVTAGNFLFAVPITVVLSLALHDHLSLDRLGALYAIASGALASGIGYACWYTALPSLRATTAATVQLSVPVIAALGGILFLGEPFTWRLALSAGAILGGIALVVLKRPPVPKPN